MTFAFSSRRCQICHVREKDRSFELCESCKVVTYCNLEHMSIDWQSHASYCPEITDRRNDLKEEMNRNPLNPSTESIYRCHAKLIEALLTADTTISVREALHILLDRGLAGHEQFKHRMPALLLGLGEDQMCYDWLVSRSVAANTLQQRNRPGRTGMINAMPNTLPNHFPVTIPNTSTESFTCTPIPGMPWCIPETSVFEPVMPIFGRQREPEERPYSLDASIRGSRSRRQDLSDTLAATLIMVRLLLGLRDIQSSNTLAVKLPQEIIYVVQRCIAEGNSILSSDEILLSSNHVRTIATLKSHVRDLYAIVLDLNQFMWPALIKPGNHLVAHVWGDERARPWSERSKRGVEAMQVALQANYKAWAETEGAIELMTRLHYEGLLEGK